MTKPVMKYGARKGKMSTMRRWMAGAAARDLRIFPVPGADVLRMHQSELNSDFIIAPNPREANVLLAVGELTEPLAKKTAVAYQQIPRPRVLAVAGSEQPVHLPEPDVQVSLEKSFLDEALPEVRRLLQDYAWSESAEPWEPEFLVNLIEDADNGGGHDHHHHGHSHGHGGHGEHDHGHSHGAHDHAGHEHKKADEEHSHQPNDHGQEGHDDACEHEHDDGEHDHGDMDFMSMVAMTKDLPRPKDGLPMNRSEVHFGPFHPGLPGGLSVFMELDGDTVIEARVENGLTARSFEEILPLEASELPDLLAGLNPLTPQTYRLLAKKALTSTFGDNDSISSKELDLLETERIRSHLNWLATFAKTLGNEWLHRAATHWHRITRKEEADSSKLLPFLDQIRNMPYLQRKLSVAGVIPDPLLHHLSGPVAKSAGIKQDFRSRQKQYGDLGWEPVIRQENNAWGRFLVRLDEIEQSLEMIEKTKEQQAKSEELDFPGSGKGSAQLESPRGRASLNISIKDGKVQELHIETPSQPLAGLVPTLTGEMELSDALVQIASLDISPWEVGLKNHGV